jgi:hypothetical protein
MADILGRGVTLHAPRWAVNRIVGPPGRTQGDAPTHRFLLFLIFLESISGGRGVRGGVRVDLTLLFFSHFQFLVSKEPTVLTHIL